MGKPEYPPVSSLEQDLARLSPGLEITFRKKGQSTGTRSRFVRVQDGKLYYQIYASENQSSQPEQQIGLSEIGRLRTPDGTFDWGW